MVQSVLVTYSLTKRVNAALYRFILRKECVRNVQKAVTPFIGTEAYKILVAKMFSRTDILSRHLKSCFQYCRGITEESDTRKN